MVSQGRALGNFSCPRRIYKISLGRYPTSCRGPLTYDRVD